jgi:hypothetical protein
MVTKLPFPETCSLTLMDAIVAERGHGRNAAFFSGISAEWRSRIETYIAEAGNPETVPNWPAIHDHRTRFHTLYNTPQEHHSQYPILRGLRDRRYQFCPSCGEEGSPSTIDHYLPKENYPHFSVTPVNLTPMCDACQTAKGEKALDSNGRRIFLHPYFDEFLESQVIRLTIGRPFNAPKDFSLEPTADLDPTLADLVRRHIHGLHMDERYGAFFRDEYIRLLRLSQVARDEGLDIAHDIPAFVRLYRGKAVNLWPHVFYTAVAADDELIEYLRNGDLPENL